MRQAAACQTPTDLQPVLDEQCGYGYMFWRSRAEGFTMYGMGGQLAVCFPQQEFCLLTMADTIGNPAGLQMIYDSFYDTIFPYLGETGGAGKEIKYERGRTAEREPESSKTGYPERTGKEQYMFYGNPMQWSRVEFDWGVGKLKFENSEGIRELAFRVGEPERQTFPGTGYSCECRGEWKAGHFLLHCYVTDEEQGHVSMDFAWKDRRMSVRMGSTGEPFFRYFRGIGSAERV